jgi:hypothetical protein
VTFELSHVVADLIISITSNEAKPSQISETNQIKASGQNEAKQRDTYQSRAELSNQIE